MPYITPFKLYFILISSFIVLFACSEISNKEQIQNQIVRMQQAISDKSMADFMVYFTDDFVGNKKISKKQLRQLLFVHFRRNRNIDTYKWQADITVEQNLAQVEIYVFVSGSNTRLPERARAYKINTKWQKSAGQWLVASAVWKNVEQFM
ncbi:hypothetical protein MNBD_GAMMA22-1227 [hydrothermal vent metagenome]|uniref:DUF4440 domain-containing protein n=1 Tax=hydrothermal vent metagenome TaxID=652676 RepID=A0A3B0ZTG1_9ZZZZ